MGIQGIKAALEKIYGCGLPERKDLERLLGLERPEDTGLIFDFADKVRREHVGDGIFMRGIIEFSNFCRNSCSYCGLNKGNLGLKRYRMSSGEILRGVGDIARAGIKTAVLQSGESEEVDTSWLREIIEEMKARFDIAVTLSVGERSYRDYKIWKDAGADRYLLKIETSQKGLYDSLHTGSSFENRLRCLEYLRCLGYEVGSGNIVGLRGQTAGSIAEDIIFFKKEDFDMIGISPFIPHPETELAGEAKGRADMALKALALTRIVTKNTNLPATTALGSMDMDRDFRIDGLKAGANVLMPNFTPAKYRRLYEIYPGKRCLYEPVGACPGCMETMAEAAGRFIDYSKGGRRYAEYAA